MLINKPPLDGPGCGPGIYREPGAQSDEVENFQEALEVQLFDLDDGVTPIIVYNLLLILTIPASHETG